MKESRKVTISLTMDSVSGEGLASTEDAGMWNQSVAFHCVSQPAANFVVSSVKEKQCLSGRDALNRKQKSFNIEGLRRIF